MKNQFTILMMLCSSIAFSQSWSENFNGVTPTALPSGWTQNNVDGLTVSSSVSAFNFGTNAWVSSAVTALPDMASHVKVVASTSWYTPAGTSNDWLITPKFNVPAGAYLKWDGVTRNASYPDGYLVKISTTDANTSSFTTTLNTVLAENNFWTTRGLSLNAYAGKDVYIAFVNNSNDKLILALDNISVYVPPATDGSTKAITGLKTYTALTTQTIAGTFRSFGSATATNVDLSYSVNNGTVVSQNFPLSPGLTWGNEANFSFTTSGTFTPGKNIVKVWVQAVNGSNETIKDNDTATAVVYVATKGVQRNALIEEFTSSTCGPCATLNVTFDPLLNNNNPNMGGTFNVIKYQANWPSPGNDPSYNADSRARINYYEVTGIPNAFMNGAPMNNHAQADIDNGKAQPAFADITASLSNNGAAITGNATITPHVTMPDANRLVVHQVLLQNHYTFPGAVTSQKEYYHVMRKMFPGPDGSPVTTVSGTAQTFSFNHTVTTAVTPAQNSFDFWNDASLMYEYVVFIQDNISKDILQSGSARLTVGLVELKENEEVGVSPNPAADWAAIGVKLNAPSAVNLFIYDLTGKLVYAQTGASLDAGKHEIKINTQSFDAGLYQIRIQTEKGVLTEKLVIAK